MWVRQPLSVSHVGWPCAAYYAETNIEATLRSLIDFEFCLSHLQNAYDHGEQDQQQNEQDNHRNHYSNRQYRPGNGDIRCIWCLSRT